MYQCLDQFLSTMLTWPEKTLNKRPGNKKLQPYPRHLMISHRIHGTGIFTYIWLIFLVDVGIYPMDIAREEWKVILEDEFQW